MQRPLLWPSPAHAQQWLGLGWPAAVGRRAGPGGGGDRTIVSRFSGCSRRDAGQNAAGEGCSSRWPCGRRLLSLQAGGDPHRPGSWHRDAVDRRLSRPMPAGVCMMPHRIAMYRQNHNCCSESQPATWALMRAPTPRSLGHIWHAFLVADYSYPTLPSETSPQKV